VPDRRLLLVGALALLAAGCGRTHVLTVGPARQVRVTLTEYRLRPDAVRARAGRVTFLVRNLGRLTHNLVVTLPGSSGVVGTTAPIPPGGRATLAVALPAGTYTIASTIQSDEALGARGTVTLVR
jgi:hypothetical protein